MGRRVRAFILILAVCVGASPAARGSAPRLQLRGDAAEAAETARILRELNVRTVADIGAGFGGYTALIAKQLPEGVQIIATELPDRVPDLSDTLKSRGASSVRVVAGAPSSTNLPDGSCDAVIVRLTYHHFSQPAEMVASIRRTLRPGGTLLMIEMPLVRMPDGEPDGIMPGVLRDQLERAGFVYQRIVDPFNVEFSSPLYLMAFTRP